MNNSIRYTILLVLLLITFHTQAQGLDDILGFDDTVDDVGVTTAPIHFLIPIAIAVGVVLGVRKLK